jgi:hypothetical protein
VRTVWPMLIQTFHCCTALGNCFFRYSTSSIHGIGSYPTVTGSISCAIAPYNQKILLSESPRFVTLDNIAHQLAADDIAAFELVDMDIVETAQASGGIHQPRTIADIRLVYIPVDDDTGAFPDACHEHFQLQPRTVLRLVQNNEGVFEGLAPHIGQRFEHDTLVLQGAIHDTASQHIVEIGAKGAEPGFQLFLHLARQESQALAGFNRGTAKNDAIDLPALEGLNRHGRCTKSLAGARWAKPEGKLVGIDGGHIVALGAVACLDVRVIRVAWEVFVGGKGGEGVDVDNNTIVIDNLIVRPSSCLFPVRPASAARVFRHAEILSSLDAEKTEMSDLC